MQEIASQKDYVTITDIVKKVFKHIRLCIQMDRSKKKLSMFEKGLIKGMISDKTLNGINGYIMNAYPADAKNLMDDILFSIPTEMLEAEVVKRKKPL